jgi:hypothetical protein
MKKRYCWLNMETGKFSDSWDEEMHQRAFKQSEIEAHHKAYPQWKLIEYTCLTDPDFEFIRHMKLR